MQSDKTVSFGEFLFPILPELTYYKDGKLHDELLFIEDPNGMFTISFEKGMKCIDTFAMSELKNEFGCLESRRSGKTIHFCYPLQAKDSRLCIGFFHLEIIDSHGRQHVLPGQLRIHPSRRYLDALKEYTVFKKLFDGLNVAALAI